MSSKRDYYDILGVSKSASESDIKQAYRKLAREHHPDVAKDGDKKKAEERFKEVNEAYQVLSDPQKRKMYDQFGHSAPGGFGNNGGGFGNASGGSWGPFSYTYTSGGNGFNDIDPFDVFEEFFGFRGFGGGRQPRRGKNLYYEMALTFSEAVKGIEKVVKIDSGNLTVKVPSGIRDGNEMRFAGKGMAGPNGVPPGDLFITFRVALPKQFERYDDDLVTAVEIDIVQAVLGGEVEIPVVSTTSESGVGSASLKIPSGTQSGTNFRLREKGMPRLSGKGQGDVIVQVYVKIPSKVSKKQRELLEEFKKLS